MKRIGRWRVHARSPRMSACSTLGYGMVAQELAQRLHAQPETSRSVLIALTGYSQEKSPKKALVASFDRHLRKPVNTKLLTEILAEIRSAFRARYQRGRPGNDGGDARP
jgi:response regulator RpfG family c-di-GMP phosphodiesterase